MIGSLIVLDLTPWPLKLLLNLNVMSSCRLIAVLMQEALMDPRLFRATKIKSDAAFDAHRGTGATGIICRDKEGRVLTMAASRIYANNPITTEAIGLREAMIMSKNINLPSVVFESDNLHLIEE